MMYAIKKSGAFHTVVTASNGVVQFKSLKRMFCVEWVRENEPKAKAEEEGAEAL